MLKEKLLEDLKVAMKDKDLVRKNTVQMIRAAVLQVEKDKQIELTDEQIVDIIAKESKKRKDAEKDFENSGREDLIAQNKAELEIISQYLPKQLTIAEIEEVVKNVIEKTGATSMKDMGMVMKAAKEEVGAAADGKTLSDAVKRLLA